MLRIKKEYMSSDTDYDEFYSRACKSAVFSKYCESLYGIDLTQDGFADKTQLDLLISEIGISSSDYCLDIGCGNGKIANYISRKTNARIDGFDYSKKAIDDARVIDNELLKFSIQDINTYDIDQNKYSKIYMIDSIYFSEKYEETLCKLYDGLVVHGKIGLLYSEFVFDKVDQIHKIEMNETRIADIISKYKWNSFGKDLTKDHFNHMKKKFHISELFRDDFINESNDFLYTKVHQESIDGKVRFEDFVLFTNRYLYCIEKV
jgi:cyclopropane fatty-acyl-phospholipid synthase-like methyltransferase